MVRNLVLTGLSALILYGCHPVMAVQVQQAPTDPECMPLAQIVESGKREYGEEVYTILINSQTGQRLLIMRNPKTNSWTVLVGCEAPDQFKAVQVDGDKVIDNPNFGK